jgi:hypothetical protein
MPAGHMVCAPTDPSKAVCCERIVAVFRQREAISCVLANRVRILLPLLLANHIAAGDEVALPVPAAADTKSGAATGNLWIGRLGCRAGFRSSSPPIFIRTSRAHDICTANLANTLAQLIRSGCAWSTKLLNEKIWNGCVQNWASLGTSTSPRSVGVRTTIRSSTASSRAARPSVPR